MNLTTTPFSDSDSKKQYEIFSFEEMGIKINILNEVSKRHKIPSGNFYKFGVLKDGKYFWYFQSVPIANDRDKMREFYSAILSVTKSTGDIPFIFKVKRL